MVGKRIKKNPEGFGDVKKPQEVHGIRKSFAKIFSNGVVTILLFLLGIFLLTPTITGNVVSNLSVSVSSIFGAILIVLAVVGHYFAVKLINSY